MQTAIRRDRLVQLGLAFLFAAAAPLLARMLFPSAAPYVPPFVLSSLVLLTTADLLLLWRPVQVAAWFCHGNVAVILGVRELRLAKYSFCAGMVVVVALAVTWVRSWP